MLDMTMSLLSQEEFRGLPKGDLNGLADDLARHLKDLMDDNITESVDISWQQLRQDAIYFLNSYNLLNEIKEKQFKIMQQMVLSNPKLVESAMADNNKRKTYYVQSCYRLAFEFNEKLNKFRGLVPSRALFVYTSKNEATPLTYEMSMQNLVNLIDRHGRIYQNMTLLNNESVAKKLEQEMKNKQLEDHVERSRNAYNGTYNRLEKYFESSGKKQHSNGILMWKQQRDWILKKIINYGDVKEAYIQAIFTEHKSKYDYLCIVKDAGYDPYYSHELIRVFFMNYMTTVTNKSAIVEEDVITGSAQYAVKGQAASAPSLNQYLKMAEFIATTSEVFKPKDPDLQKEIEKMFPQDAHRNYTATIADNEIKRAVDETKKEIEKAIK